MSSEIVFKNNGIQYIKGILIDAYTILWADLKGLKRKALRYLIATVMSPLMYLVAFGWGLGRGINVNGTNYLEFVIPGIVALTAMNASFNGTGIRLMLDQIHYRSFDESLISPVSAFSLVLGKASIGLSRGLFSSLVFVAFAYFLAPFRSGILFLLVLIVTCLLFSFLGVLAALLAKSYEDISLFTSLTIMPMTFLAGTFFPLDNVPMGLKVALYLMPLTHCSICLRSSFMGEPLSIGSFLAMFVFLFIFMIASYDIVRKISR